MTKNAPEVLHDELDLVVGGSDRLYSEIHLGETPSHSYGLASASFGHDLRFQQANTFLQQYNAPTRESLYGTGNDPSARAAEISRPGARDLEPGEDWGGSVTVAHGDGFVVNTTVSGQHPLEGTISRNLVVDLNDGGYQVLTLGRGQGGAELAAEIGEHVGTVLGAAAAGPAGAIIGGFVGGDLGQNASHFLNPELGHIAFSQLDDAMSAAANGTRNPILDAPAGREVEAGMVRDAVTAGLATWTGDGATTHGATEQDHTVYELAHMLNEQGPVEGYFMKSSAGPGVYFVTQESTRYYELEHGQVVQKPIDEFAGVDQAVEHQATLMEPPPDHAGDIQLPDPPAIEEGPPPELASRDGGGEAGGVSGTSPGHVDPDLTGENSPADDYHDDSSPSYDNGGGFDDGGYSGGYEDGGFDLA